MNKNIYNLMIVFIVLVIIGLFVYNNPIGKKNTSSYIEYTNSMYKVSWECIHNHYTEDLTEDGKVFSIYSINPDCEATFLGDFVDTLDGSETPEELKQQAKNIYNELMRLGGNATFFESAIQKSTDTNEFIKDMTEVIRGIHEKMPEEPEERKFKYNPKSKSISV